LIELYFSRGEGPFIDILQDRRYWVIPIPSGFVYKLFGVANFHEYFSHEKPQISLMNLNEIEDV
jgi:hypothetical protein